MDKPSAASDGGAGTLPLTGSQSNNNPPSRIAVPSVVAGVAPITNGTSHPSSKPSPATSSNGTAPIASRDDSPGRLPTGSQPYPPLQIANTHAHILHAQSINLGDTSSATCYQRDTAN
ncbi:hypothetical protein NQ176_g9913 [Zarea fungicola]|uniref:Uncharacterized protein n=1 Tax=Zarea fungicola TaxID=93591 RepID=A0ACC1MJU2_9HYPO|nr:hypothetical protein NQ176_g9913 [Lecanicillium fungicola]